MTTNYGVPAEISVADTPANEQAGPQAAPQTELERLISEVWQNVLHLERVGAGDNFFDLGGHSLAMVKVHERLQDAFKAQSPGREVALVEMFEYPTVRSLARHLSGSGADESGIKRMQEMARKQKASLRRQKGAPLGWKSNNE